MAEEGLLTTRGEQLTCAVRSLVVSFCSFHTPSLLASPSEAMRIFGRMRTCTKMLTYSHAGKQIAEQANALIE